MTDEKGKYVFNWKIENFSMCVLNHGERMASPIVKAETIGESEWFLGIYPKGSTCESYLSCFLYRIKNDNEERNDYNLKLIGNDDEILCEHGFENFLFKENGSGTSKFCALDKLNEKMKKYKEKILTLQCTIIGDSVLKRNPSCESIAWTKIGVDRCCFHWNVDIPEHALWERIRDIFVTEKSQLNMTLTSAADEIKIAIRNKNENNFESKCVSCKISLITLEDEEIESKSDKHLFVKENQNESWEFPAFLTKKYIQSKRKDLVQNNSFTLKCEISASNGQILSEVKTIGRADPLFIKTCLDDSFSALLEDLRSMLKNDKSSDIKLRVENLMIPANKFLLSARSPVFRAMFDQDLLEKQTGIVDIQDFDVETVNLLLEFVYTGSVTDLKFESGKKLLVAADKYKIPSLTKRCSSFLISQLSIGNACSIYALADMVSHANLKLLTLEFIKNNFKQVLLSDVWSDWMPRNVNLANEILIKLALDSL